MSSPLFWIGLLIAGTSLYWLYHVTRPQVPPVSVNEADRRLATEMLEIARLIERAVGRKPDWASDDEVVRDGLNEKAGRVLRALEQRDIGVRAFHNPSQLAYFLEAVGLAMERDGLRAARKAAKTASAKLGSGSIC